MKTDKILKLIQQKKAMRSGGALPLPKAQEGGYYMPHADAMYLTPEQRKDPAILEHEKFHRLQNQFDALRLPQYYQGPLRRPAAPVDSMSDLVGDYYNRRNVEQNMLWNEWMSNPANAAFTMVPPDLVYDKVINPWMYDPTYILPAYLQGQYPYARTSEAEAQMYEDAVRSGNVPPDQMLPKSLEYQTGGDTVSEIWKKVTGSDWSQAKKLGLTDGSYEQNMKLRNKLVSSPEYRALVSPRPQAERPRMSVPSRVSAPANSYRVQMPNMTAASDATRVAPSGRKAEYEYYSQQPFGITDPNSVMPRELQVARMAAMNNQDQIRQTQTGPRKAIQDAYRSATSTNNDLANMVTGVLGYPVQAGLNIANTVMGDTPIRSDADVAALGLDALSLIPAVKGASALSKKAVISPVPTPRVQRFMASGPSIEGLEVIRRGAPKSPLSSVTVVDKNVSGSGRYLTAKRNPKTGEYRFEFDMENVPSVSRRGHAMNLLKEQFPRGTRFQETSTMSLDSYRNLLGMSKNPRYALEATQPTFLNTQAANAKFLDDIADPYITDWSQYGSFSPAKQMRLDAWDAAGSRMMFSTKKAAEEAAKRINERYLDKFGFTERATPIKGDGKKWNVSIPNYRVTQQYLTGGSLKVRIKKQH